MAKIATNEEEDIASTTQVIVPTVEEEEWKLCIDGASSSNGLRAVLMLVNPEGQEFTYALCFKFQTTNNNAEYEALLAGLRLAKEMKIRHLQAFIDSQLVANQVIGTFEARQSSIQQYLVKTKELIEGFNSFAIEHVRRSQNKKADALSKLADRVLVEVLKNKSISKTEVDDLIQEDEKTWMTPKREYMEHGILPEYKNEARKIRVNPPTYKLMNGRLYRRSFLTPWLYCVRPSQASIIIQEVHEGICGLQQVPGQ
ncbi:uncharacterized protein [Rutidosis leptorrhynchoides]|uniref:uncharacterized protein n=1 Tax=Rutidosis leptorrhynchoides TaxID=125765 RepID=UPI003A99543A